MIVFAESVVMRKRGTALRKFVIWVVTLKGVQNIAVLIKDVHQNLGFVNYIFRW